MVLRDLIRDVFRTLWSHKLRTFLTMFGIAWGIVSIVLMVAAGEGLRKGQEEQSKTLGKDIMIVFHGRTSLQVGGARAGKLVRWEDADVQAVQSEAPDCQYALPELEQGDVPAKPPGTFRTFDQLLVTPKSVQQHEACKHELRAALGKMHKYDPTDKEACPIWDTVQEAKAFSQMTDGMKYFLGAVGLVTLFLGGIGVMNVMMVAVRERTREIGVRKALGAPAHAILKQFFIEAMVIALVSGGIGLGVAYGLCALVDLLPMPDFFAGLLPTWKTGLLACGMLGGIAVLSAMYPAGRAASKDPIEALRFEAGG